ADRAQKIKRLATQYGLLAVAMLLVAIALDTPPWTLAALLLALAGPAVALLLIARQPAGHIGILDERLLLVDHRGIYQLAGGARLQHRGPFLAIDDVVVYRGGRWLPVFSATQLQAEVLPLALAGVKVDAVTIAVKL